ncbi:MAG: LLM class flavin-dependent oxidoreductase [bacterium]|nr:LLM class flavin-dependent oxidoreductase [bacterium]
MKLSCGIVPGPDAPARAQVAESLGYDRVWLFDSPALYADMWINIARVAEATDGIGLGTAVLVPSLRHVVTTAAAITTIETLAPGRLAVAIGTGFTARVLLGSKPLPWSATERYIRDLKDLLAGKTIEFGDGATRLMHPETVSVPRPISVPILVAANGPKGLSVARELGDGVMSVVAPQAGFAWSSLLALGTVLEAGENFETPRVFDALGPAIASIYHGTWEAAGEAVDALPDGKAWREAVEQVPEAERHLAVHEGHMIHLTDLDRQYISPALGAGLFAGTREQLRERAAQHAEAGLTEILYVPCGQDIEGQLESMADAIL